MSVLGRAVVIAVGGLALIAPAAQGAPTTPVRAGDLVVVDPARPESVLEAGDSTTPFGLRVPADASCPGDSRNDGWRVQGFIVPASVEIGTLELTVAGPRGANETVLWLDEQPRPFVDQLTNPNSGPGQPGLVPSPPPMSFDNRAAPQLAPGEYRVVIACTYQRRIDRYWDTTWVLTPKPEAQPAQFAWRLTDASASASTTALADDDRAVWLVRVGAVAVAIGALAYLLTRRARTAVETSPSKEDAPS